MNSDLPLSAPKPVTQKQIAQALNISQSLVALALNDHPSVAESTRLKVKMTAREMGYERNSNLAARTLIAQRYGNRVQVGQVAVLMTDFMDGHSLRDMPFFREILQGIHDAAAKQDIDISIHVLRPGKLPRVVTTGGVDGVICVYNFIISEDLRRQAPNMPVVRLGHSFEDNEWAICPDNSAGTYALTRHLLQLGHTRLGFLGHENVWPDQMRHQGFLEALREHGVSPLQDWHFTARQEPSISSGYEETRQLLAERRDFTALVCSNDSLALGAIQAAREAGLDVPTDLSVTGFDGAKGIGYGDSTILTTAYFNRHIMGRKAVAMLQDINTAKSEPRQDKLPVRLLVRQSTSAPQPVAALATEFS